MSPLVSGLMCDSFEREECLPLLFGLFSMSSPCYVAQRFLCKLFASGDVDAYYDTSLWTTITEGRTECFPPPKRGFLEMLSKVDALKVPILLIDAVCRQRKLSFF